MDISIIICTYNRSYLLNTTLQSMVKVRLPSNTTVELIIIDNNSNDNTRQATENFIKNSQLNSKYVFERRQGLSHARNRGISEAKGDILAFLDDDVKVDKNWLINLLQYFRDQDVMCVGGRILPWWECSPPKWLDSSYFGMLALLDLGDKSSTMHSPELWGANLIFRKEVFSRYGEFDSNIGRKGKRLLCGEESKIISNLISGGEKVLYAPDVVVHHFVPKHRMTRRYFIRWQFFWGMSYVWLNSYPYNRTFLSIPLYFYRQIYISFVDYIKSKFHFGKLLYFIWNLGLAMGFYQMTREQSETAPKIVES